MEIYIADKKTLDEVKKDTTGILTKINNNNKDEYVSAKNHSYVNNKINHKFTTTSTKDYEILSVKCPNGGKLGYLHLEFKTSTDEVKDICITIKADGNVVKKICLGKDMQIAYKKIIYTLKVQSVNLIARLDKWSEDPSPDIKYFSQNKKLADVKMDHDVYTNTKGYIYDKDVISTDDIFVDRVSCLDFNNLAILVSYNQKSSATLNPEFFCNYKAII